MVDRCLHPGPRLWETGRVAVQHDAVVIGAGHNGLAAAVHLATKGWSVAVAEAAAEPGGSVKTRELTLPGFRHDVHAMNMSLFAGSPFLARHREALTRAGLAFAPAEDCFATPFPDGTWLGVSRSLDATARRIEALSPGDAPRWRAMVEAFGRDAPTVFALLGSPMPSWAAAKTLFQAWRTRGAPWLAETARLILASPRDYLDRHFEHPRLKTMMAAWGLHLDFPPDTAGGALFPYLESMANQAFGMVLGQGGADTVVRAVRGALEAAGGVLHLGTPVERIETAGGRASGVRLADGRVLGAGRAVIANVHPRLVTGRLLDAASVPAAYRERIEGFRAGPGTMMVHLALDRLPAWSAGEALGNFAYVHLAPSLEGMARTYAQAMAGLLPDEPVLVVGQPTAIDPSRAPAGQHVLWVQVRVLPSAILGDAAGRIAATHWDEAGEPYADRVLDLIERYAPGFRSTILGRAVLTPLDLERENPNLVGGDSLSGSHHLDQNFVFRPAFGWSRYRTPVPGLYQVGASTWPGAGVGAGSGFILARMMAGA